MKKKLFGEVEETTVTGELNRRQQARILKERVQDLEYEEVM